MLRPQKRITKRQLKEDKLVTFYFKAIDFIQENQNKLFFGVLGVIAIILIVVWSSRLSASKESNAASALARAEIKMNQGQYMAAMDSLKILIELYDGAQSTGKGVFYLANLYFQNEDYESAQKYYEQYLGDYKDDANFASSALAGMAACYEGKKNFKKAAELYEKAVKKYSQAFDNANKLMNAARCYILAGNKEKARTLYQQIIEDYPNSGLKNEAEISLAEINA
ncbi:tetratricopeptide repeat protein [candidate division KSB1 bacterium]|nr:tetratricopeptide repeat protein [candidate division KSB1 bacterium]